MMMMMMMMMMCQVTASGFRETDTLISREAILSVRGMLSYL